MVGQAFNGLQPGQVLGKQAEDLGVVLLAHQVHLAFHVGLDLVELGCQLLPEGLEIDLDRRVVRRQGEPVELTSTEFELLAMLAGAPGKVFSRDDILTRLRGHAAEDIHSRAVDILVSRLRRKLEPLDCVRTLRNAGYRFAGVRA